MPTNLNKGNLGELGTKTDAQKIEKVVNEADNTLNSVEKIAGKVESIISMITKLKEIGGNKENAIAPTEFKTIAPKIESGVNNALVEKVKQLRNSAKVKVNSDNLILQIETFLKNVDETKTIKSLKGDLDKIKKFGMVDKLINDFVLKNCEVIFE